MFKKNKNKTLNKQGTAIWINEIGSIKSRVFNIGKQDKVRKRVMISFSKDETYWIKKRDIRGKRVVLYKKSDGEVVAQNPDAWGRINLNGMNIKTLRFNLQNSSFQESKSAIHRWTVPKDMVDKLGPIFRLMFICIAVGVMGWAALKFGGLALDTITSSRLLDCSQILPKIVNPIGAIVNGTIPIGAA